MISDREEIERLDKQVAELQKENRRLMGLELDRKAWMVLVDAASDHATKRERDVAKLAHALKMVEALVKEALAHIGG